MGDPIAKRIYVPDMYEDSHNAWQKCLLGEERWEYVHIDEVNAMLRERGPVSLRDEIAIAAMQGQMAFSPHDSFEKAHQPEDVAKLAYRFADAMLAAREGEVNHG